MKRTAREIWRKRVRQWKASGLTARKFAERHGLAASTLHYWSWRLGAGQRGRPARDEAQVLVPRARVAPQRGAARRRLQPRGQPAAPAFVELVHPAEVGGLGARAGEHEAVTPFEVLFGEHLCLRVPLHFDEAALRRLVRVLEGR